MPAHVPRHLRRPESAPPASSPPERERLGGVVAGAMAWSTVGRFGTMAVSVASQGLIARLVTRTDFGVYALVISSAATVAFLSQLSLPQTAVRSIAGARRGGGAAVHGAVRGAVRTGFVVAGVGTLLSLTPLSRVITAAFPEIPLSSIRVLFAVLVGLRILENIAPEVFRGLRDFRNASIFGGLASGAVLAAACAALLLVEADVGLRDVVTTTALASLVPLVLAGTLLRRHTRTLPPADPAPLVDRSLIDLPLWAATVLSFVVIQMDLWVAGVMQPAEDVAIYSAAFRMSLIATIPATIANFVVPPLVVQMHADGQHRRMQRLLQTVAAFAGLPSALFVLALVLFGSEISQAVYGPDYAAAGPIVAILAAGKLANVVTGACGLTLVMVGGSRPSAVIMAVNLATTLPLQVVLTNRYGLAGLATATALGVVSQNALLVLAVHRRIGVWTIANPFEAVRAVRQRGGWRGMRRRLEQAVRARGDVTTTDGDP